MQIANASIFINEHHTTGSTTLDFGSHKVSIDLSVEAIAEISGVVARYACAVLHNVSGVSATELASETARSIEAFKRNSSKQLPIPFNPGND